MDEQPSCSMHVTLTKTLEIIAIMKNTIDYIEKITNLLNNKGVTERKHASTIASILGLQYNSAKQKLDGKRGITLDEVIRVFKYFNEHFEGLKTHNCVFIMNNIHRRCNIKVDESSTSEIVDGENYAVKRDGIFIVDPNLVSSEHKEFHRVDSIDFLPAPRIAILDNDLDILTLLEKIIKRYGIESDKFSTDKELLVAMQKNNYEAFLLDWLLDYDETSEGVVKNIRKESESHAPIIILTGQLNHYEKSIGEMILNHEVHLIEKPAKPYIISSILLSELFFN